MCLLQVNVNTTERENTWKFLGVRLIILNSKCLQNIYFSFIHSCINYENFTWACTNNTKLKKLLGKQRETARILFNQNRFTHTGPLLKTLNALNIYQINLFQVLLIMHRIKANSSPPDLPTSVSNNESWIWNSVLLKNFK